MTLAIINSKWVLQRTQILFIPKLLVSLLPQVYQSWRISAVEFLAHLLQNYQQYTSASAHPAYAAEAAPQSGPPQTGNIHIDLFF